MFSISAVKVILCVLNFSRIPVKSCIRFGPVCRQSFRLNAADDTLADASYTIRILVVALPVLITGKWGM